MMLRNGTTEPIRVRGFVATCGCTIPDLRPNIEIAPGEEVMVNVRLELWGQGRKQHSHAGLGFQRTVSCIFFKVLLAPLAGAVSPA